MTDVRRAADILRAGGLVAFPTETVYGLGADATDVAAVAKIFAAKGRPASNPLIVHAADRAAARACSRAWPQAAEHFAQRFWPGPLTLIVPKSARIVPGVTAGRDSVAVRVPDHPLALHLLREFGGPVAAPSANRATHVSPTTAQHVQWELGNAVDLILDGGASRVGIESTVLDVSGEHPMVLRLGGITLEQLREIDPHTTAAIRQNEAEAPAASPGQQAVHYAPRTPAYRFNSAGALRGWMAEHPQQTAVILAITPDLASSAAHQIIVMPDDAIEYASAIYARLHTADRSGVTAIWIEMPPDLPSWAAVRDRLMRATQPAR